jgi:hypothetical protein
MEFMRIWIALFVAGFLLLAGCPGEGAAGEVVEENGQEAYIPAGFDISEDLPIPDLQVDKDRCTDSDNGYEIHLKGTTTLFEDGEEKWLEADYCLDAGTLVEYFCENGALTHDSVKCPCHGGVCEPIVDFIECIDTDMGNERYKRGEIHLIKHYTDGRAEFQNPLNDTCKSEIELLEYFCKDDGSGEYKKVTWTCLFCSDGACSR